MKDALPVIFLGDSHIQYMKSANWHQLFLPRRAEFCEVRGATPIANRHPNGVIDAFRQFHEFLAKQDKNSIVVMQVGEADCGHVFWHRADKFAETVEQQLAESIAAYFTFVDELRAAGFARIVITGVTLPTVTDEEQAKGAISWRKGVTATQSEKTALTLAYNEQLAAQAAQRDLPYADIADDVLDPQTGLAGPHFRSGRADDHNMNPRSVAPFWAKRLNECFAILDPLDPPVRTFEATDAGYAKGLALHSRDIGDAMKLAVKEGDTLTGALWSEAGRSEFGKFYVIGVARLNGAPLSPLIKLLDKAHWRLLPADAPVVTPVAEPVAETEPAAVAEAVAETVAAEPVAEPAPEPEPVAAQAEPEPVPPLQAATPEKPKKGFLPKLRSKVTSRKVSKKK